MSTNNNEAEVLEQIEKTVPESRGKLDRKSKTEPAEEVKPVKPEILTVEKSDMIKVKAGGTTRTIPKNRLGAYKTMGYKEV